MSENFYAKYEHEVNEVLPFYALGQTVDFSTIDDIQKRLYTKRIGTMLDEKGKATSRKKNIVEKLNMNIAATDAALFENENHF